MRVIDLAFVAKAADGSVAIAELEELSDDDASRLKSLSMFLADVLSEEDLLAAGEELAPNSSAAVIVWENSWAAPFAAALGAIGGEIVASGRLATIDLLDALTETTPEQEAE